MASEKAVQETAPQQTSPAQTPMRSQVQLRALLRGDLSRIPSLLEKATANLRARFYLRRCTKVGRYVRLYGKPLVTNKGVIEIGDRVMLISHTVRAELAAIDG